MVGGKNMTKECEDRLLIHPVFEDNRELSEFLLRNGMKEINRGEESRNTLVLIADETPCEYIVILRKVE